MPRYLVQRSNRHGLQIPPADAVDGVFWLHSYVTPDRTTSFCIYDGPDAEAIRRTAAGPVDAVTEVQVLDPYFGT
jgi:Protein of unknown function (DUF4242)